MIEFIAGALVALIIVVFMGWVDVAILGRPHTEPTFKDHVRMYVFVCAWELLFFVTGLILGGILCE